MTNPESLDYRNKTIRKQCLFENETFANVNCQYAVFNNEVRFVNCTFTEDIVFGDEFNDEAYCVIKTDLVFDNCVFKKQVKLDGLQCSGHVVFKNGCRFLFDGGTEKTKYALSMSNAKIGMGIYISDCDFSAGINLSAIHIEQIGCQFFNTRLINPKSSISFLSSYMGRELSINWSNIVCNNIEFERTSVDSIHGSIQMKGKFINGKNLLDVLSTLLNKNLNSDNCEWVASLYRPKNQFSNQVYVKYSNNNNFNDTISIIKQTLKTEYNSYRFLNINKFAFNQERITIFGDLIKIKTQKENAFIYALLYDHNIYILNQLTDYGTITEYNTKEFAHCIFDDIISIENLACSDYVNSYHVGTPMIYAIMSNTDKYIAIYDDQMDFKIYKWNYIDCQKINNMYSATVGTGLFINQTEFNLFSFDIRGLSAIGEIKFQDIVFQLTKFYASQVHSKNFILKNIQFIYDNTKGDNIYVENDELTNCNWSISLNYLRTLNKIEIDSLLCINKTTIDSFLLLGNFMESGSIIILSDIACINRLSTQTRLNICSSKTQHLFFDGLNLQSWMVETENIRFDEFKTNGIRPNHKTIKWFCKTNKIIVGKLSDNSYTKSIVRQSFYPIHFLKQMENIYDKYDSYKDHKKIWKLRNKMRIERDHRFSAILRKLLNCTLLNYGWSPWRIVFWLVAIILCFDFVTYHYFGMPASTCLVNGFVEFLPVSFNKPIIDQLREGIEDNLTNIWYSGLVTGYRMLSYFLLSILVAACAGYFRKKNQ